MRRAVVVLALSSCFASTPAAFAAVEKLEILSRTPVAEGERFGSAGSYEKIIARVFYALDPKDPQNTVIVDLDRAPRDADGKVRFTGDLVILKPTVQAKGNGALFVEVPNRGTKAVLRVFDRDAERSNDPTTAAHFGDGFLLRQGFTLAWVGWQFDLPGGQPDLIGLTAPPALAPVPTGATEAPPITGLVRADQVFERDGVREMALGHQGHRPYPVANPEDPANVLTVRDYRFSRRFKIPRDQWRFARFEGDREVPDDGSIVLPAGFQKGKIYELVYLAKNPVVAGVGLTAVRDAVSYLRHDRASPVQGVDRTLGLGISQTGRFLRQFLYQGQNRDEAGRPVFDGLLVHAAGAGRGSFNHRFAQPSRDSNPFSSFFYPVDLFPFSDGEQVDPLRNRSDGLLKKQQQVGGVPKIFYTNGAYEYWGRAASFLHTSLEVGHSTDVAPGPNTRIYAFAGTQHFVGQFPPRPVETANPENPVDFRWSLRALLLALDAWVSRDQPPPPSRYPLVATGELVTADVLDNDLVLPTPVARDPLDIWRLDFGPRFLTSGIIDQEPPRVGEGSRGLISQVNRDGNEVGGIRLPEVAVPLATYTGWNWRAESIGAPKELADSRGSFLPFPWTARDAEATHDHRSPVESRYRNRRAYLKAYRAAAKALIRQGYLRKQDLRPVVRRGKELWQLLAPRGAR